MGSLYGWGAGRVRPDGEPHWLYSPVISLALLDLETELHLDLWSIGKRREVPWDQKAFWRRMASGEIRKLVNRLGTLHEQDTLLGGLAMADE